MSFSENVLRDLRYKQPVSEQMKFVLAVFMSAPPVKLDKMEQIGKFDAIPFFMTKKTKNCWILKKIADVFVKTVGSNYSSTLFYL